MKKKIRKKLLGFDVGMTCYSTLEKDEEDITIPFVVSLYITSTKIVELLPGNALRASCALPRRTATF